MIKFFKRFVALIAAAEGFIHLITAIISLWGILINAEVNWMIWVAPIENLILGIVSLTTAYVIGTEHHHHHNSHKHVECDIESCKCACHMH